MFITPIINNIVIPDECGDTLWDAVLAETEAIEEADKQTLL